MPPTGAGWERVFWDDFDGDLSQWEIVTNPAGKIDGNVYADAGELVIKVDRILVNPDGCSYAACGTGFQRFGPGCWIEAEIKQPRGGHAAWSAFWLSDSDTSGGASAGGDGYGSAVHEFDIFEYLGNSFAGYDRNYYSLVRWAPSHAIYQTVLDHGVDLSDGYHRYALHWGGAFVRWYLDGVQIKEETANFYEKACRVIFQNQTDWLDAWSGPVDEQTVLPNDMRVKWCGIWHLADWHGYQRIQYTPGSLTAGQQTEMKAALSKQYNSTPTLTHLRTQVKTLAAQTWSVEISGPDQPTTSDWVDILYTQITGMDRATMAANLVVTTATGATWDAMRQYVKGQGW